MPASWLVVAGVLRAMGVNGVDALGTSLVRAQLSQLGRAIANLPKKFAHGCPRGLGSFGVIAEPPEFSAFWQAPHVEAMAGIRI